jgi:predicted amidophosphoribosyltransferase
LLGRAINQFKYGNLRALGNTLALFLYQYMEEKKLKAALLMAVPLHTGRLKSVAIINHNC